LKDVVADWAQHIPYAANQVTKESCMRQLFYRALEKFLAAERDNILNGVSERNLCHRLGIYLEDERRACGLEGYFVDAEYNRQQNGQIKTILDEELQVVGITCDLILHSRGRVVRDDNLIAIEMKKSDRPNSEKPKDRIRLKALTKQSYDDVWSNDGVMHPERVCGYCFGAFIEIHIRNVGVTVEEFEGGQAVAQHDFALDRVQ
jgi:hypothetical protein